VEVYKLITEPAWVDEFAWEQFFFKCGNKVYVLSFTRKDEVQSGLNEILRSFA